MRQIFILERHELAGLRQGQPLTIVLGDQKITLQAETSPQARNPKPNVEAKGEPASNGRKRWAYKNGELTVTEKVIDHLRSTGRALRAKELAEELGVDRAAVSSALARFKGVSVRKIGRLNNAKWRAK